MKASVDRKILANRFSRVDEVMYCRILSWGGCSPFSRCQPIRLMATATSTLKFTVGQYDRMIAAGVFEQPALPFAADLSRVELIEGEIVMMSPIGARHEEVVDRLTAWSFRCLPDSSVRVRIQQSLGIPGQHSVPQPDIAWVQPKEYAAHRPEAADAILVIEVAETSLHFDLGAKALMYARGGVAECWVVDVNAEVVHLLSAPGPDGYGVKRVAGRGEAVAANGRPEATLEVESLFRPRP